MTAITEQMPDEFTIFRWAQEFREKDKGGAYPDHYSGKVSAVVPGADPSLSWAGIDRFLRQEGEVDGSGLEALIEVFHRTFVPLTESKIVRWANLHKRKHGNFPTFLSGVIDHIEARPDTWANINSALVFGDRGLQGGRTLPEFLDDYVKRTNTLSEEKILFWLDAYFEQHGEYPTKSTKGTLEGGETWDGIDYALRKGTKGLAKRHPSDSLVDFVLRNRPARRPPAPRFTPFAILAWGKSYFDEHGKLPDPGSGVVADPAARGASWAEVADALLVGKGGLQGGVSLCKFFDSVKADFEAARAATHAESPGVSAATVDQLDAANAAQRTGDVDASEMPPLVVAQPVRPITDTPEDVRQHASSVAFVEVKPAPVPRGDEEVRAVGSEDGAGTGEARTGQAADSHVPRVITAASPVRRPSRASVRPRKTVARFSPAELSQWIGAYRRATGSLPNVKSGKISQADSEMTWAKVDRVLRSGVNGQQEPITLSYFVQNLRFSHLDIAPERIKEWVLNYYAETSRWPAEASVDFVPNPHEMQWCELAAELERRQNGDSPKAGLCEIIDGLRDERIRVEKARSSSSDVKEAAGTKFTVESILRHARLFKEKNGRFPKTSDGVIPGSGGVTWGGVNNLLRYDMVGLHRPSTLKDLLAEQDGLEKVARNVEPVISLKHVREWVSAYVEASAEYPRATSGKVAGARVSWRQVSTWLSNNGRGGLVQFLYDEFGVVGNSVVHAVVQRSARSTTQHSR
jgi:hypothetical protein